LYFLTDSLLEEIRPRYLEAVEESLNDSAHFMASLIETRLGPEGAINPEILTETFRQARERRFAARIYNVEKTQISLEAYVTDARGVVLFDSRGLAQGLDYSRWRDVALTLKGGYGARSTRGDPADPASSVLHVAAPIRYQGRIVGVVSAAKPVDSVTPFMDAARARMIQLGAVTTLGLVGLGLLVSLWITRPLERLERYVRRLQNGERPRPLRLGKNEIGRVAEAFEDLRTQLEGRKYAEEYVQHLTHEIKSPMAAIRAAAELLEEDPPPDSRRKFLENIRNQCQRATEIVQRLLELAALENKKSLEAPRDLDFVALVNAALESVTSRAAQKRVELRIAAPDACALSGDAFLLSRAVMNLLENALDFSPPGGAIEARIQRSESGVELQILDEGPGIPDYALPRAFERFFSLPRPDSAARGVGLGLPFVRETALLHHGEARLENRPGGGASALLRLGFTQTSQ
jgi:two-component system, OmpR family, sensor histidine kinase CreC